MKVWRKVYGFQKQGFGMALRTDQFSNGQFWNLASLKDGFAVTDYEDIQAGQVLEFLISILYPKKPTFVIVMLGNTIFGALFRDMTNRLGYGNLDRGGEACGKSWKR